MVTMNGSDSTSSMLLSLPPELRFEIWSYVLGHNMIHIFHAGQESCLPHVISAGSGKLMSYVCASNISEPQVYKKVQEKSHREDRRRWPYWIQNRHSLCGSQPVRWTRSFMPPWRTRACEKPCLNVLRVCRQLYSEATPVLWQTNVFSFLGSAPLQNFIHMLTPVQKKALRKIHFDHQDPRHWLEAIEVKDIETLTGLRDLHVSMFYHVRPATLMKWKTDEQWREGRMKPFLRWRILSLQNVTVVFTDEIRHRPLLTRKEESAIAEELKHQLLDPNGMKFIPSEAAKDKERISKRASRRDEIEEWLVFTAQKRELILSGDYDTELDNFPPPADSIEDSEAEETGLVLDYKGSDMAKSDEDAVSNSERDVPEDYPEADMWSNGSHLDCSSEEEVDGDQKSYASDPFDGDLEPEDLDDYTLYP